MPIKLKMSEITKTFGNFNANDNINLEVEEGEIHAILGENGAGKSTLMNILYGLYKPTKGQIFLGNKEVSIDTPLKAINLGIGMIHQHFMLISPFTVTENIILGLKSEQEPFLDLEGAKKRINMIAQKHGLVVDPDAIISSLPVGLQQRVEILKALYREADLLILDEPTGVLTPQETVELFETLKSLAKKGHSIIFISHKLNEVLEISDRISVLRRGKKVATVNTDEVSKKELAKLMVGREVVFTVEKEDKEPGKTILELKKLNVQGRRLVSSLKNVSFCIKEGEILGVAGIDGNGQTELIEAISGLRKVESGEILLDNVNIANKTPAEIFKKKVCLVPEDRKEVGSVKKFNIPDNAVLRNHCEKPYLKNYFLDYKEINKHTDKLIEKYDIRTAGRQIEASLLSGGNLQKLILAREISVGPKVLLAMHPTRGLDVGAIEFIHKQLCIERQKGTAIILVSTELEEILSLSDRVLVLNSGEIAGILSQKDATKEIIGELMCFCKQDAYCEVK
ncbi:MAG: hypothetical protein APF76_00580 [Desulfitibacter sp. BRH_c19]|nr:MAG: hypothetical protein APF76_00580 [Desulfitibacter sp. BRH_c19]